MRIRIRPDAQGARQNRSAYPGQLGPERLNYEQRPDFIEISEIEKIALVSSMPQRKRLFYANQVTLAWSDGA